MNHNTAPPTNRVFLDNAHPALAHAAAYILDQPQHRDATQPADVARHPVVVPGARARRVLTAMLVDEAHTRGTPLTPPLIITPAEIPAALLGTPIPPPATPASRIQRLLAWARALRAVNPATIAHTIRVAREPDFKFNLDAQLAVARLLINTSDQLAATGHTFADVPRAAHALLDDNERQRWNALATVQHTARDILHAEHTDDDSLATLDLVRTAEADATASPRHTTRSLTLVAVPELSNLARRAIAASDPELTTLITDHQHNQHRFDHLGCVRPHPTDDPEHQAPPPVPTDRITFAEDPEHQAGIALTQLAQHAETLDATDAVIGIADPDALPPIARHAHLAADVTIRDAAGTPTADTPPGRLLHALLQLARNPSYAAMLTLARHPAVDRQHTTDAPPLDLDALDRYQHEHTPPDHASDHNNHHAPPPAAHRALADPVLRYQRFLERHLADLYTRPHERRSPDRWADALEHALRNLYRDQPLDPTSPTDNTTIDALTAIQAATDQLRHATPPHRDQPRLTAAEALELVHDTLRHTHTPSPPERDAIEALGWFELALDPASLCIVTGLVESRVPASTPHDPLVPESLRAALAMPTDAHRLARDTHIARTIASTRHAHFIATKRDADNTPTTPSRILLDATNHDLAHRVRRLTDDTPHRHTPIASRITPGNTDRFRTPLRIDDAYTPPDIMSVTDFDRFIASPAAWYLERHRKLNDLEDPAPELTPPRLGDLVHHTLRAFADDTTARELDDESTIAQALSDLLSTTRDQHLGPTPPAAVGIQVELIRHRLINLAKTEAARRRQGWTIAHAEWSPTDATPETPDTTPPHPAITACAPPMPLKGRIDRIELNTETGRWALIDFKTGARPTKPEDQRARDNTWRSLQLPLYRTLARTLADRHQVDPDTPHLCYAALPKDPRTNAFATATWNTEDLEHAEQHAAHIVDTIRALTPGDPVPLGKKPPASGSLGFITLERYTTPTANNPDNEPDPQQEPQAT